MTTEFREVVRAFLGIQRSLLSALRQRIHFEDRQYFNDITPGSVVVDGRRWAYRGHGRGVTFEDETGVLVNVHVAPWLDDVVDAWRLETYLDSRGVRALAHAGARVAANGTSVSRLLEVLADEGTLRRAEAEGLERARLYRSP